MQVHEITSTHNPRVKAAAKLREHRGRRQQGLFIAEGRRAVDRAHAAGLVFREVWLCPELLSPIREQAQYEYEALVRRHTGVWVGECSPAVFRKLAYVREPEGVLAVCVPPAWDVAKLPQVNDTTMDLVAVGTEKPGNLGAMVRTADAAGCRAVLAAGTPVDAMNPNAIRASTAAVFTLPTVSLAEDEACDYFRTSGHRIIAAYPEAQGAIEHTQADYAGPIAIAVGPEDRGLDPRWADLAHDTGGALVRIPMLGRADSLNASVAAAVLLYEAQRQRCKTD
ncbi:MAG: TrmH family RNA methyltransferase [Phycisphaerales bacterium JB063]